MNSTPKDRKFMEIALEEMLLSRSEHIKKEDPMVGVVLVNKHGQELARAHRGNFSAGDHAEFTIFEKLRSDEDPTGGTLYVTLEPCTKRERPKKPCAQRIVEKGITQVVIGIFDPNRDIFKKGADHLRKHGIKVTFFDEDLAEEIRTWNKNYIEYMGNSQNDKKIIMTKSDKLEGSSYEEYRPVPEASTNDFSYDAIKQYLNYIDMPLKVPSGELWSYFRKSKYLVKRQAHDIPTLAGIVIFGMTPKVFLPEHIITAESFSGTTEEGISLDKIVGNGRLSISGPLFQMVETTINFFKSHVAKVPRIKDIQRIEEDNEYPIKVIREILVNAIVHRDYTVGAHISFRIFKDQIIIKSPGHLLKPNTIERMKNFDVTPVRRNIRISEAAFNMELMEREGYGIPQMPVQLKEYGLQPPKFSYEGGYFIVTLFGREKSSPKYRIPSNYYTILTTRQLDILNFIWEKRRATSIEIQNKFSISRETVNQDFRKLLKMGLIERKGIGRSTYYVLENF